MILQAAILGIVQGFTEFLPISSSGHLAILERYFGIAQPVVLAAFLHFGTFIATVVFFFEPIMNIIRGLMKGNREAINYILNIVIGTIPIVIFALLFKSTIEHAFYDTRLVAILLGITGVVLVMTNIIRKQQGNVTRLSAFIIGIGQMFATFPGLSRSGLTISAGFFSGVKPGEAFKFSFLLSLPAVFGANLLELRHISVIDNSVALCVGVACSFVSGLLALKILHKLVHHKFYLFGIYCLIISVLFLFIK
jgi:undecaprenyl-diphosphatase